MSDQDGDIDAGPLCPLDKDAFMTCFCLGSRKNPSHNNQDTLLRVCYLRGYIFPFLSVWEMRFQ